MGKKSSNPFKRGSPTTIQDLREVVKDKTPISIDATKDLDQETPTRTFQERFEKADSNLKDQAGKDIHVFHSAYRSRNSTPYLVLMLLMLR